MTEYTVSTQIQAVLADMINNSVFILQAAHNQAAQTRIFGNQKIVEKLDTNVFNQIMIKLKPSV